MIDLESLNLPETVQEEKPTEALQEMSPSIPIPVPEATPASEPEMDAETEVLPSPIESGGLAAVSEETVLSELEGTIEEIEASELAPSGPPMEAPTLDEPDASPEEAALSEPDPAEALQASEEPVSEPEPLIEEASPETEAEASSPETEPVLEAPLSEPVPDEQALALNAPLAEDAPAISETPSPLIADETASSDPAPGAEAPSEGSPVEEGQGVPESGEGSPTEEASSPSSEAAASDALADSGEERSDGGLLASAQNGVKETGTPPPSRKKPSKAKIKKVGLLGLLGDGGGRSQHGGGRLLMAKNRLRSKTRSSAKEERFPHRSLKATQKVAGLRKKVLSSEKKRLMRRKPVGRRGRSGIKIVHGSGRNYGVISAAIQQKKGRLTNVYNRLLQTNENLQGNLIIEFVISPQGRVIKSTVLTSSIGNPDFEKALVKEISRWKFPSVKTGQTTVLYPLSFFPSS